MFHELLTANRAEILERSRTKLATRAAPTPTQSELVEGLPLFLDQLVAILRAQEDDRSDGRRQVSESAAVHGGELLRMGFTVGKAAAVTTCPCPDESP